MTQSAALLGPIIRIGWQIAVAATKVDGDTQRRYPELFKAIALLEHMLLAAHGVTVAPLTGRVGDLVSCTQEWERLWRILIAGEASLCTACGQLVSMGTRRIHGTVAAWLVRLDTVCRARGGPVHISDPALPTQKGGDYAKTERYWGLTMRTPDARWATTPEGHAFVTGELCVPDRVLDYNKSIVPFTGERGGKGKRVFHFVDGVSEELVCIRECLGRRFDLETLQTRPVASVPSGLGGCP